MIYITALNLIIKPLQDSLLVDIHWFKKAHSSKVLPAPLDHNITQQLDGSGGGMSVGRCAPMSGDSFM